MISDVFSDGRWISGWIVDGKIQQTRAYVTWTNMRKRCVVGGKYQQDKPSYAGCTMSSNFEDFQYFANWCQDQPGYGLPDYELDKDILSDWEGKLYSENTCAFIPANLNVFFAIRNSAHRTYPVGVSYRKKDGKFLAIHNHKFIKSCDDPLEAHCLYRSVKEGIAKEWANRIESGEVITNPLVAKNLRTWTLDKTVKDTPQ